MRYRVYWTDRLNDDLGDFQDEFYISAKNKKEARTKAKKKGFRQQMEEYRYRIKLNREGDRVPLIKKPRYDMIVVTDIVEDK